MKKCCWRLVFVAGAAALLAGCGQKPGAKTLEKAAALEAQKQYQDANDVLVDGLRTREAAIRADAGSPADQAAEDALSKKVEADPEILALERAQIPLYLYMQRADLASVVYTDILNGNPGDTVVYDALRDKDPQIRIGAVRILGLSGNHDAIDALAAATKDSDQDVRRAAVSALGTISDPRCVGPLIDALKDSYWFVRSEAASGLGQELDPRAVNPLLDTIGDPDSSVETSTEGALLALANRGHDVSADDFARRLNDPQPKRMLIAALCLAIMKDPRSIPVLQKLVTSPDLTTRLDAVKALGETGNADAIPTLRQTLKDPDVNMRGWSIIGLGLLKDQGSLADLRAYSADSNQPSTIRAAADRAIEEITGTDSAAGP